MTAFISGEPAPTLKSYQLPIVALALAGRKFLLKSDLYVFAPVNALMIPSIVVIAMFYPQTV